MQFDVTFKEFYQKFKSYLSIDNPEMHTLNVRVMEGYGYEFWVSHQQFIYHCYVRDEDLEWLYSTKQGLDRDALWRMFREEFLDKSSVVYVK